MGKYICTHCSDGFEKRICMLFVCLRNTFYKLRSSWKRLYMHNIHTFISALHLSGYIVHIGPVKSVFFFQSIVLVSTNALRFFSYRKKRFKWYQLMTLFIVGISGGPSIYRGEGPIVGIHFYVCAKCQNCVTTWMKWITPNSVYSVVLMQSWCKFEEHESKTRHNGRDPIGFPRRGMPPDSAGLSIGQSGATAQGPATLGGTKRASINYN